MRENFDAIPDISFIGDVTVTDIMEQMIADYQSRYREVTGKEMELAKASPYRMLLYAASMQCYQTMKYLDEMGKQNLLKYSEGAFLDQIAALRGITRLQGSHALTTIRFFVEEARKNVTAIPQGTRCAAGDMYFETTAYGEIPAGELYADIPAEATEPGTAGNGFAPGEISSIIDSVPFVSAAANITTSNSGTDVESDDQLADRIYLAPAGYSVAGPEDAYAYFVKECNADISDVKISSDNPVEVDVRFVMKNGELPSEEMISEVREYLNSGNRRPLTDKVMVSAPEILPYTIDVKYWIAESSKSVANSIQSAVETAVQEYKVWQESAIGRDINPSELIYRIRAAGAKRAEISAPSYTITPNSCIPKNTTVAVTYGGIEDD